MFGARLRSRQQRLVSLVNKNSHIGKVDPQLQQAKDMVKVTMREDNGAQVQIAFVDCLGEEVAAVRRVDDQRLTTGYITNKVAIGLQFAQREGLNGKWWVAELHG